MVTVVNPSQFCAGTNDIGEGGFASVKQGIHAGTHTRVAAKILVLRSPPHALSPSLAPQ